MSKLLPGLNTDFRAQSAQQSAAPKITIRMPKTADGKPRFPSRSDGAEAGIITGGYHAKPHMD
jgi:hypothetical protein